MAAKALRGWLILLRAHTGMLEAPLAAMGAALALGELFTIEVAIWAILGLMYHFAGYGQNSYTDWKKGYDKEDPSKSHHPLNTGEISPDTAKRVILALLGVFIFSMLLIVYPRVDAAALVLLMVLCGLTYNYYGKQIRYKFIPISIAHSLLFVVPYVYYNGGVDYTVMLAFIALFAHHTYQIAISGDIKDIDRDESSLLEDIGISHTDRGVSEMLYNTHTSLTVVGIIVAVQIVASYYLSFHLDMVYTRATLANIILYGLSMLLLIESHSVVCAGTYERDNRLQKMSRREVYGYWLIYASFIPVIGLEQYIIAFILSMVYLIMLSKFMWGTYIKPEV